MTATTSLIRRVPRGHWVAVVRRSLVRRVRRSGLVARLPLVERFVQEVDGHTVVPLHARATTSDGVCVLVLAEATVSVPPPRVGDRWRDPWPEAEPAAEEVIARRVRSWAASDLPHAAVASRIPLRDALRSVVGEFGVEVHDLALVEVDVRLDEVGRGSR